MATIQQNVAELQQNVADLQQHVEELQQGQPDILERIQYLEDEFSRQNKNNIARAINSMVNCRDILLQPFYGVNGQLIVDFPRCGADIARLTGDEINALLVALGLEVLGSLATRKECFKRYIGFAGGMD
ncbi:hypothetical protein L873DRAFT_1753158 [Choiromyces venosus 120613-1]|uniref:Prefoldin subunit alpha n=1 Tax=Choiromyces venosus 120613-1 TaxID=1336337 RepID=A0A3N4IY99_9PEZI|nr:hypothetical protein L873DRAFT_1753158 [Choiromyces venosus 120613-1]